MGYWASGCGRIEFREKLNEATLEEVLDTLSEQLEAAPQKIPNEDGVRSIFVEMDNKYRDEYMEDVLDRVSKIAEIKSGEIRFTGEDEAYWRFIWRDGAWQDEEGVIVYGNAYPYVDYSRIVGKALFAKELSKEEAERILIAIGYKVIESAMMAGFNDEEKVKAHMDAMGYTALADAIPGLKKEERK